MKTLLKIAIAGIALITAYNLGRSAYIESCANKKKS